MDYVPPHASAADLQGLLTTFLNELPATALPCVLCGDVNSPMKWHSSGDTVARVGEDAKGRVLLDALLAKGFHVAPPRDDQLRQPTSRPRKPGAQGRRIDWMAVHVCTDSSQGLGTDHDALTMGIVLSGAKAVGRRARLGPERLAKAHTTAPKTECYRDGEATKAIFRVAKRSRLVP